MSENFLNINHMEQETNYIQRIKGVDFSYLTNS